MWDNKFGVIEGVGKDAPTITNEAGGKQSSSLYAPYLLDPQFLADVGGWVEGGEPLTYIGRFMKNQDRKWLLEAFIYVGDEEPNNKEIVAKVIAISRVLKEGAEKYEANNWRLIPQEHHLSHAITHYLAFLLGDESDDHYSHFLCRLMMAYATNRSKGFDYNNYIPLTNDKE